MESHSLIKSGDAERYRMPEATISMSEMGDVRIKQHVCPNEEAVESLASRLRPFIVQSESIYLPKVLNAISAQVPRESRTESEASALEAVENWFRHRVESKDVVCYGIQLMDADDTPQTKPIMDALLAESWVYTDIVHADPKGEKATAQQLTYFDRYCAGSFFFCDFACIIVGLLNIVRTFAEKGLLQVSEAGWNEPVTYEDAEKAVDEEIISGSLYVFPVGTEISCSDSLSIPPNAMKATPVLLQRLMHPESSADAVVLNSEHCMVDSYLSYFINSNDIFTFHIDGIGMLQITREALPLDKEVVKSVSFTPYPSEASEAEAFFASIACPNRLELRFAHDGQPKKLTLQFAKAQE